MGLLENEVPKYGLKLKLDHTYPERRTQHFFPKLRQLWAVFSLALRYIFYYLISRWQNKPIVMDVFNVVNGKQIYGVPIGGIGAGTIGRGYKGEFCRYQLRPGRYEYNTVDANQFIVTIADGSKTILQSTLSTFKKSSLSSWKCMIDGSKCSYTGLYPRAWTEYDLSEYGVKLICRQISPVIPHNYKDSSLPCAVFVWSIENVCDQDRAVTISFTFKNGTGDKKTDKNSTCSSKIFSYLDSEGVVLYHTINKTPCAYAISAKARDNLSITKCSYFNPNSDGSILWEQLYKNGKFEKTQKEKNNVYGEVGVAIAVKTMVAPHTVQDIEMSLVWHMPVVSFPGKRRKYAKFYTKFFGSEDAGMLRIVDYAFNNYRIWENRIHGYQNHILDDEELPDWYKSCLFNETYFVTDGGTLWSTLDDAEAVTLSPSDPRLKFGRFAYLEGHEYRMYNTYDVHYYASFALMMNWPLLQLVVQYDMKDFIAMEIPDKVSMWLDGKKVERKVKNTVPHDAGDPVEEPFLLINAYPIHDVSEWRDLNPKFVLQVLRDCSFTTSNVDCEHYNDYLNTYMEDMYDSCKTVMQKTLKFDIDTDGLIENNGAADQTFDSWVMTGSSAYCGGLWLAALFAMTILADKLNKPEEKLKYGEILEKAKESFEKKLWNGQYYNFDCSSHEYKSIMADQMCGHWYLRSSGFEYEVFSKDRVFSALNSIFKNNVMKFCNGTMGAVNGFIDGQVDYISVQSEEVWTGVNYALGSHMIFEGMVDEAWQTIGGMYKFLSQQIGMSFETPEAYFEKNYYRSVGYMRPLSVWSMQLAWERMKSRERRPINIVEN